MSEFRLFWPWKISGHEPAGSLTCSSDTEVRTSRLITFLVLSDDQLEVSSRQESNVSPVGIEVKVKMMDGIVYPMKLDQNDNIRKVKRTIHQLYHISPDQQRLVFAGQRLEEDRTLLECNVQDGSTLILVQRLRSRRRAAMVSWNLSVHPEDQVWVSLKCSSSLCESDSPFLVQIFCPRLWGTTYPALVPLSIQRRQHFYIISSVTITEIHLKGLDFVFSRTFILGLGQAWNLS